MSLKKLAVIILFLLAGCTEEVKRIPTLEKYTKDTNLMLNVCGKFAAEPDPAALHKIVVTMQVARVVPCNGDFNGECKAYDDFMSTAIEVTQNNEFAPGARAKLKEKFTALAKAVAEGRIKISNAKK